jgi:hypothetical protein
MSENSKIEWTDHTFDPWEGREKVPGCDHYYAASTTMAAIKLELHRLTVNVRVNDLSQSSKADLKCLIGSFVACARESAVDRRSLYDIHPCLLGYVKPGLASPDTEKSS